MAVEDQLASLGLDTGTPALDDRESELLSALRGVDGLPEIQTASIPKGQGVASLIGDLLTTIAQSGTTRGFQPSSTFSDLATGQSEKLADTLNRRTLFESQQAREGERASIGAELGIIGEKRKQQTVKSRIEQERIDRRGIEKRNRSFTRSQNAIAASERRMQQANDNRATMDRLRFSTGATSAEGQKNRDQQLVIADKQIEQDQRNLDGQIERLNVRIAAEEKAASKARTGSIQEIAIRNRNDLELQKNQLEAERDNLKTRFERDEKLSKQQFAQAMLTAVPEVIGEVSPEMINDFVNGDATPVQIKELATRSNTIVAMRDETFANARANLLGGTVDEVGNPDANISRKIYEASIEKKRGSVVLDPEKLAHQLDLAEIQAENTIDGFNVRDPALKTMLLQEVRAAHVKFIETQIKFDSKTAKDKDRNTRILTGIPPLDMARLFSGSTVRKGVEAGIPILAADRAVGELLGLGN